MILVCIVLILIGALPITAVIIRRKRRLHILKTGEKTTAQVVEVRRIKMSKEAPYDQVFFIYLPAGASKYHSGMQKHKVDKLKNGDTFEIFYLPEKPQKYAIPGIKGERAMLVLTGSFFLLALFLCYKISKMDL